MITNATAGGSQSSVSAPAVKQTNAGPPILDIETANRVIEDALSGVSSVPSNPANISREKSAFNSDIINGHINHVLEQHTIETRELEALERSSHKSHSDTNNGSNANQSTTVDNSATNSISHPVSHPVSPPTASEEEELEEDHEEDDEKPLNLSSSTVLHTSNQNIIDHFIDKLLSTGIDGKLCWTESQWSLWLSLAGNSSSASFGFPFSSSLSSMSSSSDTNKPFNNQNSNNNTSNVNKNVNNIVDNNHCNSSSTSSSAGQSGSKAQSRKDRSCKGKRYLEIINENKFGKRLRTVSTVSTNSDKDETSAKNLSSKDMSSGGGSKWISGGFDLEEHIAQLPQLGDAHLLNALSHRKANKTSASAKNGSNEAVNHVRPDRDSCGDQSNSNRLSDKRNSDTEDNDATLRHRHSNNNTLKNVTSDANNGKTDTTRTTEDSNPDSDANIENRAVCQTNDARNQNKDQLNGVAKQADTDIVDNVSDLVNHSLPTTQGIEFSDGLAALAEVALQQQRNAVWAPVERHWATTSDTFASNGLKDSLFWIEFSFQLFLHIFINFRGNRYSSVPTSVPTLRYSDFYSQLFF